MDFLKQNKLSRDEWDSVENRIPEQEMKIISLINDGYNDINTYVNETKTILSLIKMLPENGVHYFIYIKHFKKIIDDIVKYDKSLETFDTTNKNLKKMKSGDLIRLQNLEETITKNTDNIYEFFSLRICKQIVKNIYKKNSFIHDVYSLISWKHSKISNVNPYVNKFINTIIEYSKTKFSKSDIIYHSTNIFENNENIHKFTDIKLYEHQKELFTLCKLHREIPKLLLYTAPTGGGKTLSPIGLTNSYKVIFVCIARHIGLSLAKYSVNMGKKIAFAFGCSVPEDIRLHYYSVIDYQKNKRTGGFGKIDNTNGANVEIMICDIQSYECAMHYMLSFNDANDIITFWDEPTITLDHEHNPVHEIIHQNWKNNKIPNVILSCATLPKIEELMETIQDFNIKFPNAYVQQITSFNLEKSIPIIDTSNNYFIPHVDITDYRDMHEFISICEENKNLLKYIDLEIMIKFIKILHDFNIIRDDDFRIENYFEEIENINLKEIKIYYLFLLNKLHETDFIKVRELINVNSRKQLKRTEDSSVFRRVESVNGINKNTANISRLNSDTTLLNNKDQFNGILLTTKDSHTLTHGPTIYLSENVENLAKFYVKESNIPKSILDQLITNIKTNELLKDKIKLLDEKLVKLSSVKDNTDTTVDDKNKKKDSKKNTFKDKDDNPEIQEIKEKLKILQTQIQYVTLQTCYIPNTLEHQEKWTKTTSNTPFTSSLSEEVVREIMDLTIDTFYKVLVLMGIGILVKHHDKKYEEIVKKLANEQKLYMILTSSDFIYGTNYQFCHGFIGKDLINMSQQKVIQCLGRIGRNTIKQCYTVRFRNNDMIYKLFKHNTENIEAINMNKLFTSDDL